VVTTSTRNSQNKVDNDGGKKSNRQYCRTESVVEAALSPHPDTLCSPVECEKGIDHGRHCDDGEESSGDLTDFVTKVEKTDSETSEDDSEVEP